MLYHIVYISAPLVPRHSGVSGRQPRQRADVVPINKARETLERVRRPARSVAGGARAADLSRLSLALLREPHLKHR